MILNQTSATVRPNCGDSGVQYRSALTLALIVNSGDGDRAVGQGHRRAGAERAAAVAVAAASRCGGGTDRRRPPPARSARTAPGWPRTRGPPARAPAPAPARSPRRTACGHAACSGTRFGNGLLRGLRADGYSRHDLRLVGSSSALVGAGTSSARGHHLGRRLGGATAGMTSVWPCAPSVRSGPRRRGLRRRLRGYLRARRLPVCDSLGRGDRCRLGESAAAAWLEASSSARSSTSPSAGSSARGPGLPASSIPRITSPGIGWVCSVKIVPPPAGGADSASSSTRPAHAELARRERRPAC